MTKLNKKVKIAIIAAIAIVIIVLVTILPFVIPFKGKANKEVWAKEDVYKLEDTVVLNKTAGKDFVILNMTDIQLNDTLDLGKRDYTESTIKKLVEEVKPDLITMTGDQIWAAPFTRSSLKYLIKLMDSFKIPWAPVMGNHDGDGNADFQWVADRYAESEYCVFRKGPNNIGGVGNYIINIMENNLVKHSLIMIDSGSNRNYPELKMNGYDFIGVEKQEWYKWAINGVKSLNAGSLVESSCFFHIALPEFQTAYDEWIAGGKDPEVGFGVNDEKVCSPPVNSGFFEVIKSMGSTKNVVIGHDHVNSSSILYQGIRLTYGLKTGDRCYADAAMNGGTVLKLTAEGVTTEHHYIK